MTTVEGSNKYRVIGTRPMRHAAVEKETGAAKYGVAFEKADYAKNKKPFEEIKINLI